MSHRIPHEQSYRGRILTPQPLQLGCESVEPLLVEMHMWASARQGEKVELIAISLLLLRAWELLLLIDCDVKIIRRRRIGEDCVRFGGVSVRNEVEELHDVSVKGQEVLLSQELSRVKNIMSKFWREPLQPTRK